VYEETSIKRMSFGQYSGMWHLHGKPFNRKLSKVKKIANESNGISTRGRWSLLYGTVKTLETKYSSAIPSVIPSTKLLVSSSKFMEYPNAMEGLASAKISKPTYTRMERI